MPEFIVHASMQLQKRILPDVTYFSFFAYSQMNWRAEVLKRGKFSFLNVNNVVPYPEKFYRLLEGSLKALNSPVCN
jgi:hypothetical protein